jgi:hypothetical protein
LMAVIPSYYCHRHRLGISQIVHFSCWIWRLATHYSRHESPGIMYLSGKLATHTLHQYTDHTVPVHSVRLY